MPERTLSMIVEGTDDASGPIDSATASVIRLGKTVADLNPDLAKMAQVSGAVEEAGEPLPGLLVKVGGSTVRLGQAVMDLNPELARLAQEEENVGSGAGKAVMPLMYLASSFRIINRRVAIGIGRIHRIGKVIADAGGSAAGSAQGWLLAGVGLIAFLAIAKGVVSIASRLVRSVVEWTGVLERSDAAVSRATSTVSRYGKEIQIGSADLATSSRVVVMYTGDLDEMINKMLETSRAGNAMDRLHDATSRLGSEIGIALSPAVDAFVASIIPLIHQYGPDLIAWAEKAGVYLGQNLPRWIDTLVGSFGDLIFVLRVLGTMAFPTLAGPAGAAIARGFQSGTRFAPGGLAMVGEGGPELVGLPRGSRVWSNRDTQQMMSVGPITVNVGSVGGDPYRGGQQIGKGILAELRRKGAA